MRLGTSLRLLQTALIFQTAAQILASAERESLDRRAHRAIAEAADDTSWAVTASDLVIVLGTTSAGNHPELLKATRFWKKASTS